MTAIVVPVQRTGQPDRWRATCGSCQWKAPGNDREKRENAEVWADKHNREKHPDIVAAIDVKCPACNAKPGKPCTAPTDTGRREVRWSHLSRVDAAREVA